MAELQRVHHWSSELGTPGVQALRLAVRRNGIDLMRKDVAAFVQQKGEKAGLLGREALQGEDGVRELRHERADGPC